MRFDKGVEVAEVARQQPTRAADVKADVVVPLLQAGVTGAVASGLLTWALAELAPDYSGSLVRFWGFWALLVGGVVWVVLLVDTRSLLRTVERLVGRDLDRDGTVGPPRERVVVVGAARGQRDARERENQVRRSQFRDFVSRLPQLGTGYDVWESRLGRDVYVQFRDALLRLGLARWNGRDPRQGWRLVVPVADVLERVQDGE